MRRMSLDLAPLGTQCPGGSLWSGANPPDGRRIGMDEYAVDCYGRRIANHLAQGLQDVPDGTVARLKQARQLALMQKKAG